MKPKGKPDAKIPTTQTKPNTKRTFEARESKKIFDTSLLKKNEFALIVIGALLLTSIIFFLFFRSSDPAIEPSQKNVSSISFADLEKRIDSIEQALQIKEKQDQLPEAKTLKNGLPDPMQERVTRLETAFLVKFDSLMERIGKIENSISQLKNKPEVIVAPKPMSKTAIPVKKAVKKEKIDVMFHTVQKGETLYSISKKYNTSIAALQKINNLSPTAKIYPGNNILIR